MQTGYNFFYDAVVCPYAYGVYVSRKALMNSMEWLKNARIRTFIDLEEAKAWVEYEYVRMQSEQMPLFDPITRLDWCYFRKSLSGDGYSEIKLVRGVYYDM